MPGWQQCGPEAGVGLAAQIVNRRQQQVNRPESLEPDQSAETPLAARSAIEFWFASGRWEVGGVVYIATRALDQQIDLFVYSLVLSI